MVAAVRRRLPYPACLRAAGRGSGIHRHGQGELACQRTLLTDINSAAAGAATLAGAAKEQPAGWAQADSGSAAGGLVAIRRLLKERAELVRCVLYSEGDVVVQQIDARIHVCCTAAGGGGPAGQQGGAVRQGGLTACAVPGRWSGRQMERHAVMV